MMNSFVSPFPIDLNEDHNHNFNQLFSSSSSKNTTHEDHASSSSNSTSNYPILISSSSPELPYFHHQTHFLQPFQHLHEGVNIYASHGGPLDHSSAENSESGNKFSVCKKEDRENSASVKWMSSKMRLMRKMMNCDQTAANISSDNSKSLHKFDHQDQKGQSSSLEFDDHTAKNLPNNNIRVCSDCNTTKTPLWRSGPRGPKSLCNACGIRQRKARRALAAAQESENGEMFDATNSAIVKSKVQNKEVKRSDNNSHLPFKKRCKFTAQAHRGRNKKLCVEDLSSIILTKINNNSAFQQVFPQDEKEAAILLMALSYGLVRG